MAEARHRDFATIVYAESAPENWMEIADSWHIETYISPYHDKDVEMLTEECVKLKKPHWHVMLCFDGKKSDKQVRELTSQINGVGLEHVVSHRGMMRYLCHLDNPEKAQYEISDVKALGGGDYVKGIQLPSDTRELVSQMQIFVRENSILTYSELLDYALEHKPDWHVVLSEKRTLVMIEYIKSNAYRLREERKRAYYKGLGFSDDDVQLIMDGTKKASELKAEYVYKAKMKYKEEEE